jgi:hypothetical protein
MFISWWRGNIRAQGEARKKKENRAPGFLSVAQAEDLTAQQRVSDLARELEDVEAYRERLLGSEYAMAFLASSGLTDSQRVQSFLRCGIAYSINSSAPSRIDCGTVRPSALAVLALTTILNLIGS